MLECLPDSQQNGRSHKHNKNILNVERTEERTNKHLAFISQATVEEFETEDLQFIVGELTRMEIADSIYETVWLEIDAKLRQIVVPQFWQRFQPTTSDHPNKQPSANAAQEANERAFFRFQVAVLELHNDYRALQLTAHRLTLFRQMCFGLRRPLNRHVGGQPEADQLDVLLRVVTLSQLPANFSGVVHAFYSKSFRVFLSSQESMYS